MSRTGNNPIEIPSAAKVALDGRVFRAEGPKGKLEQEIVDPIEVKIEDGQITCSRPDDSGPSKARHGLVRALLCNAVAGVTEGFSKELEIHGVGYRGEIKGKAAHFRLGYSHDVIYPVPEGIQVEIDGNGAIKVSGADRQKVGQVAAEIRSLRKPDAYKGKGIRYKGEQLRLKVGKAGVS